MPRGLLAFAVTCPLVTTIGKLPDPTLGWELLAMASTFARRLVGALMLVLIHARAREPPR